jgi:6-pyruvoyl-tetrahydropterin synthase
MRLHTNIRNRQIMNLSVSTHERSFCILTEDMKDKQPTATNIASWIINQITATLGPDASAWTKVNSFASDTCNTMKAVWPIIQSMAGLEHVFCIGCDSHSLQLLMKDLLGLPR